MPQQIEQVTLDVNGAGTVRFTSAPLMRMWDYNRVTVTISTGQASAPNGTAKLYRQEPIASNLVSGSRTPWDDVAGFPGGQLRLTSPEYITVQFENCDPGAVATVIAEFNEHRI